MSRRRLLISPFVVLGFVVLCGCSGNHTQGNASYSVPQYSTQTAAPSYDVGGSYTDHNIGIGLFNDGTMKAWTEAYGTKVWEGTWKVADGKVYIHLTYDVTHKPGDVSDVYFLIQDSGASLVRPSGKGKWVRTKR